MSPGYFQVQRKVCGHKGHVEDVIWLSLQSLSEPKAGIFQAVAVSIPHASTLNRH